MCWLFNFFLSLFWLYCLSSRWYSATLQVHFIIMAPLSARLNPTRGRLYWTPVCTIKADAVHRTLNVSAWSCRCYAAGAIVFVPIRGEPVCVAVTNVAG